MSRYAIFDETDGTLVSKRYKDELGNDTYLEFAKTFDTEEDALRELDAMQNDSCRVVELKDLHPKTLGNGVKPSDSFEKSEKEALIDALTAIASAISFCETDTWLAVKDRLDLVYDAIERLNGS